MLNVKNILKKDNLIAAAGLGIGSVAAEAGTNLIAPKILKTPETQKFAPGIPIVLGLLMGTGTGVVKSIGHGMIAAGAGQVFKAVIPTDLKDKLSIAGYDGEVMMNGTQSPLMSTRNMSDNYDFTSASSGEMDY